MLTCINAQFLRLTKRQRRQNINARADTPHPPLSRALCLSGDAAPGSGRRRDQRSDVGRVAAGGPPQRLALASTWLLGIANFKSLQALRKLGITSGGAAQLEALNGDEGHEQRVIEQDNLLHVALRYLSAEQRGALELVYFHGLHYQDIARVMDCPENTVKTRIFHARKRLREIWPLLTGDSAVTGE